MRLLLVAFLFAISYAQTGLLDTLGSCACKPLTESLNFDDMTDEVKDLMTRGYGGSCSQWDLNDWTPYPQCDASTADYCGDQNWCVLGFCYVDESCESAAPSDAIKDVPTQIFYSYETCGVPNCFVDPRRVGCPYDPTGEYDCSTTIQVDAATTHPVETGCPSNTGTADLDMDFSSAVVIHRNLHGKYCGSVWNANGDSDDNSVRGATMSTESYVDVLGGATSDAPIPEECVYTVNGQRMLIPEQILYCNVGQDRLGNDLCIRVVDVSETYLCRDTFKCGNVQEENSIFGQIQIDQTTSQPRVELEFTVMSCNEPDGSDCVEVEWDNMFMSFLDIDGTNEAEEEIKLQGIWDYYISRGFDPDLAEQWKTESPFHAIYPGDTTVDNTQFDTQEAIMFPNMNIEISDPQHVYRWENTNGHFVDNRLVGDVTVRNRVDISKNGNVDNPTDLTDLTLDQASRAITAQWVSDKWLNQNYNGLAQGDRRTSFRVTMGTKKRTILFAGQAEAIVSLCDTCGHSSFVSDGNTCPNNQLVLVNRVCSISGHAIVADLDNCSADYCCESVSTSHGDPIIWTFNEECYDLNKDGLYLASKHPDFDHEVKIAVHNDFMREIQVIDSKSGDIMLAINTLGEVLNSNFPFALQQGVRPCPEDMDKSECDGEFSWFEFDAQNFHYSIHLLRHNYLDPALQDGQLGYHLDIYPQVYPNFRELKHQYTGLYFENPLPEELPYCAGGAEFK